MSYITEINLQRVRLKLEDRKKSSIKKYSAQKTFYTSLYDLILTYGQPKLFIREVTEESIQEPASLSIDENASQGLVKIYQFTKNTGRKINYFSLAKDINAATGADACSLFDLLRVYFNLLDHEQLNSEDITIIPLVQVKNARNHFNTIAIQNQKFYLIEPRRNDRQILFSYPIQTHIKDAFDHFITTREHYELFQLYTGQQNDFNDTECAAHHVNYVSALANMDQLATPAAILAQLSKTQLKLRMDDIFKQGEMKKILQPINLPVEDRHSSNTNSDDSHMDDDFTTIKTSSNNAIQQASSLNNLLAQLSPAIKNVQIEKEKFLKEIDSDEMETKNNSLDKRKLNAAAALIKHKYFIKRETEFFYRIRHTRDKTVNYLLVFLKNNAENCEDAAEFLFSCYDSLKDKNGRLGLALEQAIALLVDVDLTDIRQIQKRKFGWKEERNKLFKNLAEKIRAKESYVLAQSHWKQIDSIETSFGYRSDGEKQNNKNLAIIYTNLGF